MKKVVKLMHSTGQGENFHIFVDYVILEGKTTDLLVNPTYSRSGSNQTVDALGEIQFY